MTPNKIWKSSINFEEVPLLSSVYHSIFLKTRILKVSGETLCVRFYVVSNLVDQARRLTFFSNKLAFALVYLATVYETLLRILSEENNVIDLPDLMTKIS